MGSALSEIEISFTADRTNLQPGECATLRWGVQGGLVPELDGQPVDGLGQREVCPEESTAYHWQWIPARQ